MRYLLLFLFAGFCLAEDIVEYELILQPETEQEFSGTVTLTLSDKNIQNPVKLEPGTVNVIKCSYGTEQPPKSIDTPSPTTPSPTTPSPTTSSSTTSSPTTPSPTTPSSTTSSSTTSSPEEETKDCEVKDNQIIFHKDRGTKKVILKFTGKYNPEGFSSHGTENGKKFYVADLTRVKCSNIFPCQKGKAKLTITNAVMSNIKSLGDGQVDITKVIFVQGDISPAANNDHISVFVMKQEANSDDNLLKNVTDEVAEVYKKYNENLKTQILFTPLHEEVNINSPVIKVLSDDLIPKNLDSDRSDIAYALTKTLFKRKTKGNYALLDVILPAVISPQVLVNQVLTEDFVVKQLQPGEFEKDGFNNSKSLKDEVSEFDSEILPKDSILYSKGALIIRSLKKLCAGDEKFDAGVKKYITEDVSEAKAFEGCFANSDQASQFFETWEGHSGYPVVHVAALKDAHYNLIQERFLWFGKKEDKKWGIPLEYTEKEVSKTAWFPNENINLTINATYFTLNNNYRGFFRVNYDDKVWNALISQLKSDHSVINEFNRAQLIDDVFSFPRSTFNFSLSTSIPTYVDALGLSEYLKKETSYFPLKTAFNAFNFIDSALNGSLHGDFRSHVRSILSELYKKFGPKSNSSDSSLTNEVISWACRYGVEECVKDANERFSALPFLYSDQLSENLRTILCSVLRSDTQNQAIVQIMVTVPTEKDFMYLVGCSRDRKILSVFLNKFIYESTKDNFMLTLSSMMENNPDNMNVTLGIVDDLKDKIELILGKEFLESIVKLALPKVNVESAKRLQNIVKYVKNDELQKLLNRLQENVKVWSDKKAPGIRDYMKQTRGSGSHAKPAALILVVTTLLPFVNHVFNS